MRPGRSCDAKDRNRRRLLRCRQQHALQRRLLLARTVGGYLPDGSADRVAQRLVVDRAHLVALPRGHAISVSAALEACGIDSNNMIPHSQQGLAVLQNRPADEPTARYTVLRASFNRNHAGYNGECRADLPDEHVRRPAVGAHDDGEQDEGSRDAGGGEGVGQRQDRLRARDEVRFKLALGRTNVSVMCGVQQSH